MQPRVILKLGNALLIAALLAGLTMSTALAGDDAQVICEGNGGLWEGGNATDGPCIYPFNNALSINDCGGLNNSIKYIYYVANAEFNASCITIFNLPLAFNDFTCFLWAGEFSGDATSATCTISHDYFGDCPATTVYHGESSPDIYNTSHFECTGSAGSGGSSGGQQSSNPGFGNYGGKIKTDQPGSAQLGGNKNGSFHYDAGTCAAGCIYSPNLPGGAASSLPNGVVATLYVRLADDGAGSYTVCFDVTGISSPVIYRYISDAWVAQPLTFTGGQVCTSASGDGAFALGGLVEGSF